MSKSKDKAKAKKNAQKSAMRWRTGMINKKERQAMERYNLDPNEYSFGGKLDARQGDEKTYDDMREDFTRAAANDYDTRRTLEAAALSGKSKAQDIIDSGFKNPGDIMNAQNFFKKAAKRHGQGGNFSSTSDFMGLTQSMVERDRRKLNESIDSRIDTAVDSFETKGDNTVERDTEGDYEYSNELATARGTIDAFNDFVAGGGMANMLSGDAQGSANAFRQQRADNIKQYLKPNPQSQLGKGLNEQGLFNPILN